MRTRTFAGFVVGLLSVVAVSACDSGSAARTDAAAGGKDATVPVGGGGGNGGNGGNGGTKGDVAAAGTDSGSDLAASEAGGTAKDVPLSGGDGSPGSDVPIGGADGPFVDGHTGLVDGLFAVDGAKPSQGDGGLVCGVAGAGCQSAADCCGLACVDGVCSSTACFSDGVACSSGSQCCSTVCGAGGTCTPLNPSCKTAGNACTSGSECCSKVCNSSRQCAPPSTISYCAQTGDICRTDGECCTGVCSLQAGAQVGTCATITTSCQVDGTVCNGCGTCCSHFCGPFGAGGPSICQPASGCHVQGDLCRKDSDCCGGDVSSGLPGAGLIRCEPDPVYGARIGTCGGPKASNCPGGIETCKNACNPEGNVCHYKQTLVCGGNLTNVRNDCCGCISGKECCQPDATGIPRCNALTACVPVGGHCSFSGECCGGQPCLPDPATGQLLCGTSCVAVGGACTTNHDCCTGMVCHAAPGAVGGICQVPLPPPPIPGPDAGLGDGGAGDDAATVDAPVCAFYGQACSVTIPCCGSTCTTRLDEECTAADTDCICFSPE